MTYLGFGQRGDVSFPGIWFANRGRTLHAGQHGGMNMMRDLPRFVSLIERGYYSVTVVRALYGMPLFRK